MKITIKPFSDYKKYLPQDVPATNWTLEVSDGATIEDVLTHAAIPVDTPKVLTVNDSNQKPDFVLSDNDILKIFPMAMGG